MFCFKCGKKLPDESVFCMKCGTRLPKFDIENDATEEETPVLEPRMVKKSYGPPEGAVIIPKAIAESEDKDEKREWFEEHRDSSVFAFEEGTEYVQLNCYDEDTGCDFIKEIYIPDSVTKIGRFAFGFFVSLKSITIPNSVTKIGEFAFSYCSSLESITIPNSVTKIGANAFLRCYSLKTYPYPIPLRKLIVVHSFFANH